jgi:hypothetical protein
MFMVATRPTKQSPTPDANLSVYVNFGPAMADLFPCGSLLSLPAETDK